MPSDRQQIENLEDELDLLDDPTTEEVLAYSQDYDAGIVAATAARLALAGGGGGGGGSLPAFGGTSPLGYSSAFYLQVDGGQVDGGSYTLTISGQTTAAISWNEDPSAKMQALSSVGAGNAGTSGPNELPDRTLIFFTGDLLTAELVVGTDITIGSQALTYLGSPVTLVIQQWETGQEPAEGSAITDLRVETDSTLGLTMLWVNVGTAEAPDWRPVNATYAYASGVRVSNASVSVDSVGATLAASDGGQFRATLTVRNDESIYITLLDASGNETTGIFLDSNGIRMPYLPTSDPGGSGRLWKSGDTVKIT